MDLDDRVLATHTSDEVRHHFRPDNILDDLEDGRLFLGVQVVSALQQLVHAQVLLMDAQHLDQRRLRHFGVLKPLQQGVRVVVG